MTGFPECWCDVHHRRMRDCAKRWDRLTHFGDCLPVFGDCLPVHDWLRIGPMERCRTCPAVRVAVDRGVGE